MRKRILSVLMALTLMASVLPGLSNSASAASALPISVSDTFKNSQYYTKALNAYNSHSNQRDRFVAVALSQNGYVGGTSKGQWAGNGSGGQYTEYGRFMGADGADWCASFVSWCAAAAGIPDSIIKRGAGAGHWRTASGGTFTRIWSSDFKTYIDYKPQVGDLALYTPYCTTCNKHYNAFSPTSHVVIVASVNNTKNSDGSWTFTTIERSGNVVGQKTLTTKTTRGKGGTCSCGKQSPAGTYAYTVQGFFHPNWSDSTDTTPITVKAPTDAATLANVSITSNNAVLINRITKPTGAVVKYVGLVLYKADWTPLLDYNGAYASATAAATSFDVKYNLNKDFNITLEPGQKYIYRFYTNINGTKYVSEYQYFTTPCSGHNYGSWTKTSEPTCTSTGSEKRTCSACGNTETRVVASTGHNYKSGVCTVCGAKDPNAVSSHKMTLQIGSPYLYVDGRRTTVDAQGTTPVIINNRTMLPIRAVIENMGGTVLWNNSDRSVDITCRGYSMHFVIDKANVSYMNPNSGRGGVLTLDSPATIVNNRTLLPIRAVMETLGASVSWESSTKTVDISWTD